MAKFFTKKVCLITLAVVVALAGVIWAVVANIRPKFRSGINELPDAIQVSGNGTASVMVDDYLYFVGSKVATADIQYGDNEYYAHHEVPDTGIYRVKIGDNGVPALNYTYDNSGLTEDDAAYNTNVNGITDWEHVGNKNYGIQAVVPKIAGHDKTAMWVFGKYLIYTSPHNRTDSRGNLLSNYLDFYRVDLDGNSKSHTFLYQAENADITTSDFTVWADSRDNIYLLVVDQTTDDDGNTIKQIKKINVKTQEVTTLDTKVGSVVLPTATQYNTDSVNQNLDKVYGGVMANVFYTKTSDTNTKGNTLYCCAINDGEPVKIAEGADTTFTPLAVTPYGTGDAQFVFSVAVTNVLNHGLCVITNQTLANYHYTMPEPSGLSGKTVAIYANGFCTIDSKLYHYQITSGQIVLDTDNNALKSYLPSSTVDSVLAVIGNDIYVQSGASVYIVNTNGSNQNLDFVTDTTTDESTDNTDTSTETTANNTLPLAVLYQPRGNTGKPMLFVANSTDLRLYRADNTFNYLRLLSAD
ncbi:MAG: hypothetical protein KIG16_04720 [Eubacteriales bacterium]|nr:hypothetical protein [Eubacteriales bacterium]